MQIIGRFRSKSLMILAAGSSSFFGGVATAETRNPDQIFRVAQAQEKAVGHAEGVIKGVEANERQLLINHGPISGALQMPAMTMAFHVAPGVDLSGLAAGAKVKFTVTRDAKGLYVIEEIEREK